jgi:hypothetical protein
MGITRFRRRAGMLVTAAALVLVAAGAPATADTGATAPDGRDGATSRAAVVTYPPSRFRMDHPGTSQNDDCWATYIQEWESEVYPWGSYVSAEWDVNNHSGGRYGMLRARAAGVGSWEQFVACRHAGTGAYYFGAWENDNFDQDRLLVSAEQGYTGTTEGMLRVRATALGPWELFFAVQQPDGSWALMAYQDNGTPYVSAERAYGGYDTGMLRARAAVVGLYEKFYIPGMPPF